MNRFHAVSLSALVLLAAGCEISPVVSAQEPTGRYASCERASQDYCEHVVEAKAKEMEKCVADYTFQCLSGGAR